VSHFLVHVLQCRDRYINTVMVREEAKVSTMCAINDASPTCVPQSDEHQKFKTKDGSHKKV